MRPTLPLVLFAIAIAPAPARAADLPIDVVDYVLPNGLRVVLSPDHRAPTVGLAITFDVGRRDEPAGKRGIAHLVEHVMFEGSKNLGPGELMAMVHHAGGDADGVTFNDRTVLTDQIPSHWLERLLWAEADRMRAPDWADARLDGVRRRVRRETLEQTGRPFAPAAERLDALLVPGYHAASDTDTITLDDLRAFHGEHYTPAHAVLAIAGDFDEKEARAWIEKYFGAIAGAPSTTPAAAAAAPVTPAGERKETLRDPLAPSPMLLVGWRVPETRGVDGHALELLAAALGGGESSRLDASLVEKHLATSAQAGLDVDFLRGAGVLVISLAAAPGHELDELGKRADEELARVRDKGLTPDELKRAKAIVSAGFAASLDGNEGRAQRLAQFALIEGDPRKLRGELDRYAAVTAADVSRVAKNVLVDAGRVVVSVLPAEGPPAAPAPAKGAK